MQGYIILAKRPDPDIEDAYIYTSLSDVFFDVDVAHYALSGIAAPPPEDQIERFVTTIDIPE